MSCYMEGYYRAALLRQIAEEVDDYKAAVGYVQVTSK